MTRRNRHRPSYAGAGKIADIIRESDEGYFVATTTDGRIRVGLKNVKSVTSRLPGFKHFADSAPKLLDEDFHNIARLLAEIAACPCKRCNP